MKNELAGLNLLRGMAALVVFLSHLRVASFFEFGFLDPTSQTLGTKIFFAMTRQGMEAVIIFFVLSGYLVGGKIILNLQERNFNLEKYIWDRTSRIFIPLIPAVLLTFIIEFFLTNYPINFGQLVSNMIGLNGIFSDTLEYNGSLWTIAYEIWFYILGATIGALIIYNNKLFSVFILGICGFIFTMLDPHFLLFWLLGASVSFYQDNKDKYKIMGCGILLIILGSVAYQLGKESFTYKQSLIMPLTCSEFLVAQGACLLIPALKDIKMDKFLKSIAPFANYISKISYTLYLVHYPIMRALDNLFPRSHEVTKMALFYFIVRGIIVFMGANIMWFLFERNTQGIKKVIQKLIGRKVFQ